MLRDLVQSIRFINNKIMVAVINPRSHIINWTKTERTWERAGMVWTYGTYTYYILDNVQGTRYNDCTDII